MTALDAGLAHDLGGPPNRDAARAGGRAKPPTILYELYNSTLPQGTGIATYARTACALAAELGYRVEGLLHADRPIDPRDDILAQIDFFDARHRVGSAAWREVRRFFRRQIGVPRGIRARPFPRSDLIVGVDGVSGLLRSLDGAQVAQGFMDNARHHFRRYGRAATLHPPVRPDIFHATQAIPLRVPGARNVYTIHDLVPLRLPQTTLDDKRYFYNMVRHLGRTADRIVTVSEASKRDLVAVAGIPAERIVNTYQAVSFPAALTDLSGEEAGAIVRQGFGLEPGGYYLFYGAIEPKKNVGRLIDAFAASGTGRPLVVAGGLGWQYDDDLAKLEARKGGGLRRVGGRLVQDDRIRRLDYVPLFQLVALIRGARALLFPSLYEGFGLPVLESMSLGTPVVTSRTSSLGEVAGDAALLVEPTDVSDIMRAIQAIDADDALRDDLSARGRIRAEVFSVAAYRDRLGRLYEDLLAD